VRENSRSRVGPFQFRGTLPDGLSGSPKGVFLVGGQFGQNASLNAAFADDRGQGETHAPNAERSVHAGRDGHHRAPVQENGLYAVADASPQDRTTALRIDWSRGPVAGFMKCSPHGLAIERASVNPAANNGVSPDQDLAPDGNGCIAVVTDHERVNRLGGYIVVLGHPAAKFYCFLAGAKPKDLVPRARRGAQSVAGATIRGLADHKDDSVRGHPIKLVHGLRDGVRVVGRIVAILQGKHHEPNTRQVVHAANVKRCRAHWRVCMDKLRDSVGRPAPGSGNRDQFMRESLPEQWVSGGCGDGTGPDNTDAAGQ